MSSGALPPLTSTNGSSSRDDRDEQRTPKVKPLPLMMSSRAPLGQAAAHSPVNRVRSGPGQPQSSQPPPPQQQLHNQQQPVPNDPNRSGSPVSPNSLQAASFRSKFIRTRGLQGGASGQMLTLEGNALQQQPGQAHYGHGSSSGGGGSGGGGIGVEDGSTVAVAAAWPAPAPRPASGGGSGASNGITAGAPATPKGGGAGAWATRRGGGSAGNGSGGPASLTVSQRAMREVPSLEGIGLAAVGGSDGGGSRGGHGTRSAASATFPKYFLSPGSGAAAAGISTHAGGVSHPETAPSSHPPAVAQLDLLAATHPAVRAHPPGPGAGPGGGQLATPPGNPPSLHASLAAPGGLLSWAAGYSPGAGAGMPSAELAAAGAAAGLSFSLEHGAAALAGLLDGVGSRGAADAESLQQLAHPPFLQALSTDSLSATQPSQGQAQQQQQQQQQQQVSNATQLLQRLYRTNRTPPCPSHSLTDPLTESPSPGHRSHVSNGRSPSPSPTLGLVSASLPGGLTGSGLPSPSLASLHTGGSRTALGGGGISGATSRAGTATPGATAAAAFSTSMSRPRTRAAAAGSLADLSAALQKSIAAGMGEWDLRANGTWGHPDIQQRLLRGPLAPEALKNRYRMEERDIISLYRLLYSYSVGFFTDVESLLDIAVSDRASGASLGLAPGSTLRQELLENVFRAYAALWDEALMIVFDSEMTSVLADKKAAMQALQTGAVELESLRQEKNQLQTRLEEFVKQNIDNMLATRHMQQATSRLEGEIYALNSANEQLVTNLARHAVQISTLERQLDAARAATEAAEARAAAAEAHMADLKAIIANQNATLSAQFFQIKELERSCNELQEVVRNVNRRRAAVLGLLSGNTPEPSDGGRSASPSPPPAAGAGRLSGPGAVSGRTRGSQEGSSRGTGDGGAAAAAVTAVNDVLADMSLLDPEELGRLLADKTRAFNLMHADFVVKMHELDDQRSVNAALQQEIAEMQAAVKRSDEQAAKSKLTAERFRAKWESGRMVVEDLEEANRRLIGKNAELVRSYWPLMTRLKDAEAQAARCREEAAVDRQQAEADRAEADRLRAMAAGMEEAMKELEERRAEAASHELELPHDLLSLLPEGPAAVLRRFTRSCHRRVAHLNAQVVALVDQVTALRLQALTSGNGFGGGETAPKPGGGSGSLATATTDAGVEVAAASAAEAAELRSAVAIRDKWLGVLVKAMSTLMGQMENIMARDWDACKTLRLEQQRRKRRAARAALRAARAAAGLEVSESEPVSPERSMVSVSRAGSRASPTPGGGDGDGPETGTGDGGEVVVARVEGAISGGGSATSGGGMAAEASGGIGQEPSTMSQASAGRRYGDGGTVLEGVDEEDEEDEHDAALVVASGRLAQLVGVGPAAASSLLSAPSASGTVSGDASGFAPASASAYAELTPQLVALDRGFERLCDSAERMIEWSEGLLKRKEQTSNFVQVKQKLDTVVKQLGEATAELTQLRPTAEALRHSVKSYETKTKELTGTLAATKQRADAAEARLAAVEGQLTVVGHQLEEAQTAHKLLEAEYWKAKDLALDAEVMTGELKAGRMRALDAAAKALAAVTGLEKEARANYDQRVALEADLVGYKAWLRHMEATERKYRALLREMSELSASKEERDRKVAELQDRITTLEQQLRFKMMEVGSLESRLQGLSGELVEERRAARAAQAAARASYAAQLDAAIRQAGAAEAEAAAQSKRVAVLEARFSEATRALEAAQAAAEAAEARLPPLVLERDRLKAHVAASQPLLQAMDAAATAIGRRLTLLEDAVARGGTGAGAAKRLDSSSGDGDTEDSGVGAEGSGSSATGAGSWEGDKGSLDDALGRLLFSVESALDAFAAVAADAAGDGVPAALGALEGLVAQLLSSLSKGGKEPLQSLVVLKAQLARDDKELAELRSTMAAVQAEAGEAAKQAAEQRSAASAATAAAAAATAAAARDARRAADAEAALRTVRGQLEATRQQLADARLAGDTARRHLDRSQRCAAELESDLAAARSQCKNQEALAAAAQQQCAELKRRSVDIEEAAARDQDAAREARAQAVKAEAEAAAAAARIGELEGAAASERREAERLRGEAEASQSAAAEARSKAVELQQEALEMQAKFADMVRHDESIEERLRHARFDAETLRKRAAEAAAEAAAISAQYEALQQRAWHMQVALQAKQGEKEDVLRELVEVTHVATARKAVTASAGAASVKQRGTSVPVGEVMASFKASRTAKE